MLVNLTKAEIEQIKKDMFDGHLYWNEARESIKKKLSQKPKTMEELGWKSEYQKKYNILFYSKNVKKVRNEKESDRTEIFNLNDKTISGNSIEDMVAIILKYQELFEEKIMSREYTTKLDEDDIKYLEMMREDYIGKAGFEGYTETLERILYVKQKPYTNFDKIKDEMTIKDLLSINEDGVTYQDIAFLSKEKPNDIVGEEKAKKWLESEVKE